MDKALQYKLLIFPRKSKKVIKFINLLTIGIGYLNKYLVL